MVFPGHFTGKVAVVTGAAQGIGRTVALRLTRKGAAVALVDRSPLVEEVRNQAEAAGTQTIAVTADLETLSSVAAAMDTAKAHFGHIDILINNVGGTIWGNLTPSTRRPRSERRSAVRSFPRFGAAVPRCPECESVVPALSSTCLPSRRAASTACPMRQRRAGSMPSLRLWRWNMQRTAFVSAGWRLEAPKPRHGGSRVMRQNQPRRRGNGTTRSSSRRSRRA